MEIKQIEKTMIDVLNRYSKKNHTDKTNIQVCLNFQKDGTITYTVLKDYRNIEKQSVQEILGLKKVFSKYLDPFNLSQIVPTHIACSLIVNANRLNIDVTSLNALILHNKKEGDKESVRIALYNNKEYLEELPLKDMFSDENIQTVIALQQEQNQ
jgi:uncharacterized metal-binding protein